MDFGNVLTNTIQSYIRIIKSNALGYIVNSSKECATNFLFYIYLSDRIYETTESLGYRERLNYLYNKAKELVK